MLTCAFMSSVTRISSSACFCPRRSRLMPSYSLGIPTSPRVDSSGRDEPSRLPQSCIWPEITSTYGHATPKLLKAMRSRALELGIHFLSDDAVVLGGVRFLGTTLWTDFELMGHRDSAAEIARAQMRDYRKIRIDPRYRKLLPSDTLGWHRYSRRWLEKQLLELFEGKTIIVSHHAPSPRSIQPEFASDELSAAYASNLEPLIESSGAAFWIHGHTHFNVDYVVGQTRVLTNQRGYIDEPSPGFDPKLVLEI